MNKSWPNKDQNENLSKKLTQNNKNSQKYQNGLQKGTFFDFEEEKKWQESSNESQQEKKEEQIFSQQQNDSLNYRTQFEFLKQYLSQLYSINVDDSNPLASLKEISLQDKVHRKELQSKLFANDNFEKAQNFVQDIFVLSIDRTKCSEIVTIQIQCGWYKTKLLILNLSSNESQESYLHSCAHLYDYGAFGNVYIVRNRNQNYAIKCINTNRHQNEKQQLQCKSRFLIKVIKEYFFLKFFSQLKIGPKLKKCYGFDLVFSSQCAEFSMEVCSKLILSPQNEAKLKESLRYMHLMQIIHRDIKPSNLMWSTYYQTPVFIDFGNTTFIKEKLGYKTLTQFVGTVGFVSAEMSKIFVQKSGIADLYFNDFIGLSKTITKIKNQVDGQFHLQNQQIKEINLFHNAELYLYLVKHRMFTKQYEDLFCLWSQMENHFFYIMENIEYKILQFLIELLPNTVLMKIYWSLSAEIRSLQVFEQLKDIYSDEASIAMYSWAKFYFKQKKFLNEISLYRYIEFEYQNLDKFEKLVSSILISKETIQNYMNIYAKSNYLFQNERQISIFWLVTIHYCTLTHDQYSFSLNKKLQLSTEILLALQKYQKYSQSKDVNLATKKINFLNLIFSCKLQKMKPIATLFQYFMFQIWNKIPAKFQEQTLKKTILTLQLLGYPFYLQNGRYFFLYHLFFKELQNNQSSLNLDVQQKMKSILKYWKVFALIKVYDQIFYDKNSSNFYLLQNQISDIIDKIREYEVKLMKPESSHQIFETNHNFYLFHRHLRKSFQKSYLILDILSKTEISMIFRESKFLQMFYREWKYNILLILNLVPQKYLTSIQIDLINEQKMAMMEFQNQNDFSLNFTPYLLFCKRNWNLERVIKMLKIIDNMIVCQDVTQRFFIQLRIFLAWKNKDVKTIKKLSGIIFEETKLFSVQNFMSLTEILTIFHSILIHEGVKFWCYVIRKLICFEHMHQIIERAKEYVNFYLNAPQFQISPEGSSKSDIFEKKMTFIAKTLIFQTGMTELQVLDVFDCVKNSLSWMSTIVRFSGMLLTHGRQGFKIKRSTEKISQCVSLVQHLHWILPQTLTRSLFLSSQSQQNLKQFITQSIQKLQSLEVTYSQFHQQKESLNSRAILEVKIADYDNVQSLIETIEQLFTNQQLNVKKISKSVDSDCVRPSPRILSLYYISRIMTNNELNLDDYENLILSYNTWKDQSVCFKVLFQTMLVQYLFNAFVYCQKDYSELFNFLLAISQSIKVFPQNFAIQVFYETFKGKFSFKHSQYFPFKPQNWKPLEFMDYLFQEVPKLSIETDSYFSLVLYEMLVNNFIPHKVRKRFFLFIIKSIETLTANARSLIFYRLYEQAFNIKIIQKGWYDPGQYTSDYQQKRPEVKIFYDDDAVHRQFYYAQKTFKRLDKIIDIEILVQERFNLKKLRRPEWKIPPFIERIYRKKIYKYHFIKGGFDDNEFEIDPHVDLIKQLCEQHHKKESFETHKVR